MIYKKTNDFRWYKNQDKEAISSYERRTVLQQRWENIKTGESKWDNIPFIEE